MAAHRYWRAVSLEAYGLGALALSEFQLLAGTSRVDASATLTSNISPITGALANLKDDDTATAAAWAAGRVAGLVLSWDFGGGGDVDVTDVRVGSVGTDVSKFLFSLRMQFSDDAATWTDALTFSALTWPGVNAKTTSLDPTGRWSFTDHGPGVTVSDDQFVMGSATSNGVPQGARGLVGKSAGTLQFEITLTSLVSGSDVVIGVGTPTASTGNYVGGVPGTYSYNRNGNKYLAGAASSYGAAYTTGDVIGVVVNFTTGSLTFYKNGTSQGVASATGMLGLTLHAMAGQSSSGSGTSLFTMRGRGFVYPIAGASEWSAPSAVLRNRLPGRMGGGETVWGSQPMLLGAYPANPNPMQLAWGPARLPKNYGLNMLGQGIGIINGTIKEDGSPDYPVRRRVRLLRELDSMLIDETWSDAVTGAYSFRYVDEKYTYTVISYDHFHNFRAVVADNLVPDLMT